MTVLDRYVARLFLSAYALLLAAGFAMYVFADVLVNFDEFTEDHSKSTLEVLAMMADFYGYNLPMYFAQLGGPMMAIAASFTFALMLKHNEMTALVSAGMPLQRLLVPVLVCSMPLMALWLANNEILIPRYAERIARSHDDVSGMRASSVKLARDTRGAFIQAANFFPLQGQMNHVIIVEPDATGLPAALITADEAQWDAAQRTWRLTLGRRLPLMLESRAGELGGAIQVETVDQFPFGLAPEAIVLEQSAQLGDLMSTAQMNAVIAAGNSPRLPTIQKNRDIRFTRPLLVWILMLLAIPHFLTCAPANVIIAAGRSILYCGACFLLTFICHAIAPDSEWGRYATVVPIVVFGPVALYLVANART